MGDVFNPRGRVAAALLACALLSAACGPGGGGIAIDGGSFGFPDAFSRFDAAADPDAGPFGELDPLSFGPCSQEIAALNPEAPFTCATLQVPRDWDDPNSPRFDLTLVRLAARAGQARGELWPLVGGPGGSTIEAHAVGVVALQESLPDVDVMLLDYRGMGFSARLGCPRQEAPESPSGTYLARAEYGPCLDAVRSTWGEAIRGFSSEASARDLAYAMARSRRTFGERRVLLRGISYGGYASLRFLQLFPAGADGVVLDSPAVPGRALLPYGMSRDIDQLGRDVLAQCSQDAACAARLGAGTVRFAEATAAEADAGQCAAARAMGFDAEGVRLVASSLLDGADTVALIPAFYYRLHRCNSEDIAVLQRLADQRLRWARGPAVDSPDVPPTAPLPRASTASTLLLARAEMWDAPAFDLAMYEAERASLLFEFHTPGWLAQAMYTGPTYLVDASLSVLPRTDVPVLVLQGTLDARTPVRANRVLRDHFRGAHQRYIELPNYGHHVMADEPVARLETHPRRCPTRIALQFLADPRATLDLSCLSAEAPLDFVNVPSAASTFGTASAFGDAPTP